jgi:hypothetical protein
LQAEGVSIGSGTIESTVKQIGTRIKLSGAQWKAENVPQVLLQWTILKLRLARLGCTHAISALLAIKPFVSRLIAFIIVAMSVPSKFAKCCKRIVKGVAYEASVVRVDLPTTRL